MPRAQTLNTLTEWLRAPRDARSAARFRAEAHIRASDHALRAWVQVAPQPGGDGPLAGIPYGAKDIIETRGLATEWGSPIYRGRIGTEDAWIVRELRARGAVLMGKTHTTAFAHREPAPTRNPRHLEHTPGGSSSGSAAAVAAGMVPFALGTQTRGSVLRPASYCGVTGFKPTYGLIPMEGVLPFSVSLDTLGFFTHTPEDMLALWTALGRAGRASETGGEEFLFGTPASLQGLEPEMAAAFAETLSCLRAAGLSIRDIDIAALLARVDAAGDTVMHFEGARVHEERYREHGARMAHMGQLVERGLEVTVEQYEAAKRVLAEGREEIAAIYANTPVILVPAATGPAPRGLASTGDAAMNAPWTALGTPAISIPMPVTGLPLGLQLTAAPGEDVRVLEAAVRVARLLAANR